jgi:mannose-6-phosphate isomerase-like protein (cupin superfamily)
MTQTMSGQMRKYPYTIENGAGERLTFTGLIPGPNGVRIEADGVAQRGAGPPMHVHYLQEEAVRVVSGRMGYQVLGKPEQFVGPGESVVWPAGTAHRSWNAGESELRMTGWCAPADNVEFFLGTLFASVKANGGRRPGIFDAAFLMSRYRAEYAMLDLPIVVRRFMLPLVYAVGLALGRYAKYADAPPPITSRRRGEEGAAV